MSSSAPPPQQPLQGQPQIHNNNNSVAQDGPSWEGDKMFNIYIYDYCTKRGFTRTAKELMAEAEIPADSTPPINARQGLLFEWWSVFWVLFQAKSGSTMNDEAVTYTSHQQNLRSTAGRPSIVTGPPSAHPSLPIANQPPPTNQQQPGQPALPPGQQPPMNRLVNGSMTNVPRPPTANYMTNGGPMTNGVSINSQPPQMQGNAPMGFGMPHQANGAPGPGMPPQTPGQPFNMMPGQRQNMNGAPQPQLQPGQRPPNAGPFQSPTMAHSPQNNAPTPGGHPGQQPQPNQGQPPQQAPMAQLGGPSPHMMSRGAPPGSMLPPNGMGPAGGMQQSGGLQSAPGYPQGPPPGGPHQGGRPPSRTNTPGSAMMAHASPSMANRQAPPQGGMMMTAMAGVSPRTLNSEFLTIPLHDLGVLKNELGLGNQDINVMNNVDKAKILGLWQQKNAQRAGNAVAGPSNMMAQQQRPGSQQMRAGVKRNSTSPGEEHESLPGSDSSPREPKRIRRSPAEPNNMTPASYAQQQPGQPGQSQQPGPSQPPMQGTPQQMNTMMMMRAGMPMNGAPPGPPPPQIPGAGAGAQQMGGMMSGQMQNMGMHPNTVMMHPSQMAQFRQQQQRPMNPPGGHPSSAQSPAAGGDPGFNHGGPPPPGPPSGNQQFSAMPLNRMGQNKMMPPPSPAMNGQQQGKDQNKDGGANKPNGPSGGGMTPGPEASPRGQPAGVGTAPPTPIPGAQSNSNTPAPGTSQGGPPGAPQSGPPPPPGSQPNPMGMMPSASPMLGMGGPPPGAAGVGAPELDMFNPAFMTEFEGLGATDFYTTGTADADYAQDFHWFSGADDPVGGAGGMLDMNNMSMNV